LGVRLFPCVLGACIRLNGGAGHHAGRRGGGQVGLNPLSQGMEWLP
jgi:hypothetical protein